MNQTKKNKIAGLVIGVIGIFPFLIGLLIFAVVQKDISESITAQATVIGYEEHSHSGKTEYQTVLEYRNEEGRILQFTDEIRNYEPRYELNEKVEIIYVPDRENTEKINTLYSIYFLPVIITFFGFGCMFFGRAFYTGKVDFKNNRK